ncbi:hypothetical protein Tdes44962_MAKER05820 [Teratosphaeria destructans]|uniref:Uncharacterized protein n=1 Tax=Teratosphaeria destructans TaxID=418781 RepID=A0A9W7SIX1_9PEZI|nr:hypothetical protein Tdes44962_MAKER05820 [Teratosphaeria destructans]
MTSPSFSSKGGRGVHAHIFQPPKSPASAFTSPAFATSTTPDYFGAAGARKRSRADSNDRRRPDAATPGWRQCSTPGDVSYAAAFSQDISAANESYRLAGGLDTPGLLTGSEMEQRQLYVGPLARERNGGARLRSPPNGSADKPSTWTGMAFGFVSKFFSFGTSVFKGFYAGGGKGYAMPDAPPDEPRVFRNVGCSTPLPGAWQNDEDRVNGLEHDNPHSPSARPTRPVNKRRQTDRESWVMVGTPDLETASPKRKQSAIDMATRQTIAVRPSASRASSRKNIIPLSRRQTSDLSAAGSAVQPPTSPTRRASFAPMRSSPRPSNPLERALGRTAKAAYVSPEAERYVKRNARRDRKAESAIGDMSRKLADLIRQGQEALGTKYSVEGSGYDDEDEGFVDEEW